MSKVFTRASILLIVVGLLLALIPASALTSEASGTSGHIGGIYFRDGRYGYIIRGLEGKTLPSAIGIIDTLVSWHNDSSVAFTGYLNVIMTKPDDSTLIVNAVTNQETNLAPGDQIMVEFDLPIDQSGPWVVDVKLTDFATGRELDNASASFTVAGISPVFKSDQLGCNTTPCSVTFTNLTTGGSLPYKNANWSFGDGTIVESKAVNFGEIVTHDYTNPGVFNVELKITDAEDLTVSHVKVDYIEIGEGGIPVLEQHTWSFSSLGFFPRHLPDTYRGTTHLADLDPADIPPDVQGVYYEDGTFWAYGAPGTTLHELVGGLYADYMVAVTGDCEWDIPLP